MFPVEDSVLTRAKSPARLLDLMAAGVPVVVHAVGEYAQIVEDGISGIVVPQGDLTAMAEAVIALLENPSLRSDLAEAGRFRARTDYSWDRLAEQAERAYAR
jgi:glycosyltransferase involved in cell wall biosynthesis